MKIFSRVFFGVYFTALVIILFMMFYLPYRDRKEHKPLDFRSAIVNLKWSNGSAYYFIDLSNGKHFMFQLPYQSASVGDSIIKIKDEEYFTVKKADERIICLVGLTGKIIR